MPVRTGSNISSLVAQRRLNEANSFLARSLERLSSGSRINRASDDAAGLAVAAGLHFQGRVYTQAIRNGNDALSALSIAEGSLSELTNILTRLKELATQSSNGVFSRTQRLALDDEGEQLANEYNRIVASTTFNGLNLTDGSLTSLRTQLGLGTMGGIDLALTSFSRRKVGTGARNGTGYDTGDPFASILSGVGDFNQDGDQDVVVRTMGMGNNLIIYSNNGSGSFTSGQTIALSGAGGVTTADFNGDGYIDIGIGTSTGISVYRGQAGGTFNTTAVTSTIGSLTGHLQLIDLNKDGVQDLVHASGSTITTLMNSGSGTFSTSSTISNGATVNHLRVGDLEGDGDQDIIATTVASNAIRSYRNGGAGVFAGAVLSTFGASTVSGIDFGDLDNDGILDVVSSGSGQHIGRGLGDGTFSFVATVSSYVGTGPKIGDFTGDGILDFSVNDFTTSGIFKGRGDLTFENIVQSATGISSSVVGDFNGDGVDDAIGSSNTTGIWGVALSGTSDATTLQRFNLTTQAEAIAALSELETAFQRVANERGSLGSIRSRVEAGLAAVAGSRENFIAAAGRITDADTAAESADLLRYTILRDASAAVLAQANQTPALVLLLMNTNES